VFAASSIPEPLGKSNELTEAAEAVKLGAFSISTISV